MHKQDIDNVYYETECRREWCSSKGKPSACFLFARKFTTYDIKTSQYVIGGRLNHIWKFKLLIGTISEPSSITEDCIDSFSEKSCLGILGESYLSSSCFCFILMFTNSSMMKASC